MLPRAVFCLTLFFLAAYAYAPLWDVGFLGTGLLTLLDVGRLAWPTLQGAGGSGLGAADLYAVPGLEGRPLPALVLVAACRLLTEGGRWVGAEALLLRTLNLVLLLLSAWALARFVRRALVPRTGTEGARFAGYASAMLLVVHPLCVSVVASPAGIGDLLGLGLAAAAATMFLTGRQDRRHGLVVAAVLLTVVCGFASEIAYFLAVIVALVEFTSSRRYRPVHVRLRTAGTTLVVFSAAASVELAVRALLGVPLRAPRLVAVWLPSEGGLPFAESLAVAVEKLGILIMPLHPFGGLGALGFMIGGAVLLAALEPALVAARSAPRLWGWLLGTWCGAILLVQLSTAAVRVPPQTFANAETLFPAAVVMAVGLGVASTALSGLRRQIVPALVGAGYALLAHTAALPYVPASAALVELRADLDRAREAHGRDARFLIVDPPGRVAGLEVVDGALGLLLDPALTGEPERPEVRGLSLEAFRLLARQPEFDVLRSEPLVLVFPTAALGDARPAGDSDALEPGAPVPLRSSMRFPPPAPAAGTVVWRSEARSPLVELDPLHYPAVRVTALADTPTTEVPVVSWRARADLAANASLSGAWIDGPEGPVAFFDVERSFPWLIADEIARLWFEGDLAHLITAEVLDATPELEQVVRRREGRDWHFDFDPSGLPDPIGSEGTWRVTLLDLAHLEAHVLPASAPRPGRVVAADAATWEERAFERGPGPIAWSLEFVAHDTTLARSSGRIAR